MPSFSFKGFNTGSAVAISATQNAQSDMGSVSTWGQAGTGSLSISTRKNAIMTAPAGVWFEITDASGFDVSGPGAGETYDRRLHEITYIWTFDDAGGFSPPGGLNILDQWNDRNVAYGYQVCHIFETPGDYTVSVWAIDSSGNTGFADIMVTVVDADEVYADADTIVFSNDAGETWSGAPSGAIQATSLSALDTAIAGKSGNCRVLFKRGQTVENFGLSRLDNAWVTHWGSWGTGADPILSFTDGNDYQGTANRNIDYWNNANVTQVTFENLVFQGAWDSTTETGYPTSGPIAAWLAPNIDIFLYHKCTFTGLGFVYLRADWEMTGAYVFSECKVTNWKDYGLLMDTSPDGPILCKLAVLGCEFAQHQDALQGQQAWHGSRSPFNTHGPMRLTDCPNVYLGASYFFSRAGWSLQANDVAEQPCLRLNASSTPNVFYNVDRVVCEGGGEIINGVGLPGFSDDPGNYVFDKMLLCATAKLYEDPIRWDKGGSTFRNILCVVPDIPQWHGFGSQEGALFNVAANGTSSSSNNDAAYRIYNCTGMNLRSGANDLGWQWDLVHSDGHWSDFTAENNVMHGPNLATPVDGDEPIDLASTIAGFTPRYPGIRHNFPGIRGPDVGNVSGSGGTLTVPYPSGTDQAYWLAHGENTHTIVVRNTGFFTQDRGEISVIFGPSNISVTNTSGVDWTSGNDYNLRLDRTSQIPPVDTVYANPPVTSLPRPMEGSNAFQSATIGLSAYDDFLTGIRNQPASRGAVEAS